MKGVFLAEVLMLLCCCERWLAGGGVDVALLL